MPLVTTDSLADKLAPKLQAILLEREEEIIHQAGDLTHRLIVRVAFPTFVNEVPSFLRSAIDLIREEFGAMNVNDIMDFLSRRAN